MEVVDRMAFGVSMNQKEIHMNAMTTLAMFRANYADLNSRTGEARANVFADINIDHKICHVWRFL